jgi:hypothetical protein
MKVRFINKWIVPGFGRNRFPVGYVDDVPAILRDVLPTSATILPDDFQERDDMKVAEVVAADRFLAEQNAANKTVAVMNASGMDGWADATDPNVGPQSVSRASEDELAQDVAKKQFKSRRKSKRKGA